MKQILYIFILLSILAACSNEERLDVLQGEGTLVVSDLSLQRAARSSVMTRNAVDPDLAVEILASDGNVYRGYKYAAGEALPDKFSLIPADYTLHAYSENASRWQTENDGRGAAVYEVR